MTRHRVDVDFGTNSHTASPQGGIDLFMGLFDSLHRFGPHIGFNPYIIGNIIYKVPAFGNDWMNANGVFIAECLPEGIDAHNAKHGCVKCVDALIRRVSSMSRASYILDGLTNKSVAARTNCNRRFRRFLAGMHLHGHIDIIKFAFVDKLALTMKIVELTFPAQFLSVSKLDIFFGRNGKENDIAAKLIKRMSTGKPISGGEHCGLLHMVSAGMGRAVSGSANG